MAESAESADFVGLNGFVHMECGRIRLASCLRGHTCFELPCRRLCRCRLASPELLDDSVVRVEGEAFMAVVLASMRRFVAHTRLQALACLALANLAFKKDEYVLRLTSASVNRISSRNFAAVAAAYQTPPPP